MFGKVAQIWYDCGPLKLSTSMINTIKLNALKFPHYIQKFMRTCPYLGKGSNDCWEEEVYKTNAP